MMRIRFQGQEYLLIGDSLEEGGAITTDELYKNGECSYAHLHEDGKIMRFQQQIGTRTDIETLETDVHVEVDYRRAFRGLLTSPTWDRP